MSRRRARLRGRRDRHWPAPGTSWWPGRPARPRLSRRRRDRSLDQVALGGFDLHTSGLEIRNALVEFVRLPGDLEQDPALVAGDVGSADVGDDLELLAELVDDRFLYHRRPEYELQPPPRHF